ncbi:hypothetical protein ACV343_32345, partial [Pseudomonas aeruginosa]
MSHSQTPFVRGYDGLSVQRLLAISYDDDCPLSYLPLHGQAIVAADEGVFGMGHGIPPAED